MQMLPQRILPLAAAVALTLAAGLSIAEEHVGAHAAATDAPPALSATRSEEQRTDHGGIVRKAVDIKATQGKGGVVAPPAVGSRALAGSDEESPEKPSADGPANRSPE
jgi:hypothetical protein